MTTDLGGVLGEMRLRAEAALVRRLDAGAGFADPRIPSQIYLRDDAALGRIAIGTLRPQGSHRKARVEVARAISAIPHVDPPRLATLVGPDLPPEPIPVTTLLGDDLAPDPPADSSLGDVTEIAASANRPWWRRPFG